VVHEGRAWNRVTHHPNWGRYDREQLGAAVIRAGSSWTARFCAEVLCSPFFDLAINTMTLRLTCSFSVALLLAALDVSAQPAPERFDGMAEASAAAVLDSQSFTVADDECNTLLTYEIGRRAPVGHPLKLSDFLDTHGKASDIEAAARVGDVVYWLSSHSLTKDGKSREWRYRFFATRLDATQSPPALRPIGQPYKDLLEDLEATPHLRDLKLDGAAKISPERDGGLNIEGLASWNDGSVLIGFRSPLRKQGNAILVPLENPDSVVGGFPPRFGAPLFFDLGGRGVRSIEHVEDQYLIVAGPIAEGGTFSLYSWSGRRRDQPVLRNETIPPGFIAEALIAFPSKGDFILLSDDGATNPPAECDSPAKRSQKFRTLRFPIR